MKIPIRKLSWLPFGALALLFLAPGALAAQPEREREMIQVLTSNATPQQKDEACQKLKIIGTSACIPAVAALLTDEQLSHSARYVLESMRLPEAEAALVAALPKTSGQTQLGIICSLGACAEPSAVPALLKLTQGGNEDAATAAAYALGKIASPEAQKALQNLAAKPAGKLHDAAVDGLLRCAVKLVSTGRGSKAVGVFERVYQSAKADPLKVAAYRGMIEASGPRGLRLVTRGITGPAGPAQIASLQLAREIKAPRATAELSRLLPRLDAPVQLALVEALGQRGDPVASPYLLELMDHASPDVRVSILTALRKVGDASVVPVLAQFAATGIPPEKAAARQTLVELRRGNVTEILVRQLAYSTPEVQGELARALGDRGDQSAFPRLFEIAQKGPDSARQPAIKALGLLVDEAQLGYLVRLVVDAPDAGTRSRGAEAVNSACQRIAVKRGSFNVKPLVQGASTGPREARIALLPVCSGLINPEVRMAIRRGVEDPDPQIASAGARALCDAIDPDLVEDVLSLARVAKDETIRSLAVAGGVRLLTQEETVKLSKGRRVSSLRALLAAAHTPEQKRLVLAGLGEMPDLEALHGVEPLIEDNNLRSEASRAAMKIAVTLPTSQAREALPILQKALDSAPDGATRNGLQATVKQIQDRIDYITDWLVAGPFRQDGKDYAALFDIVFPPEMDNPKGVEWKPLPAGTDPKRPYVLDLLSFLGGQQCVAYARTWLHVEKDLTAMLELGSDDGIKIWLNDKQVFALNTARALQPGTEKVNLNLHSGWNMLLFKVTQNNMGWEFCARVVNPDGSRLEGLQVEAAPKTDSASVK